MSFFYYRINMCNSAEFKAASVVEQVRNWVDSVVVGHRFCPFAQPELIAGRVRIIAPSGIGDLESALHAIASEAERLLDATDKATTLIVLSEGFDDFDDYLQLVEIGEDLLADQGWEEDLQLASFHPDYCFEGVEPSDAANYTNRSPLPIIHLLKQSDVAHAIDRYPDVDAIPERNQELAREKGAQHFEDILQSCRKAANLPDE